MVFQDYALYPYLTARGNLEFPLKMRKLSREERAARIERTARLLDIAPLLDRLPKQMSGGQRQRVAMGRALVREPSVFLLDEPLSNLDAKLRVQVRAEIKELQQRTNTTMVYVTHDQVEAMTLGHRVAVLHQGRLQQVAPPRVLYDEPANAFVAGFIGNPPMNLFPALVEGTTLRVGSQSVPIAQSRVRRTGRVTAGVRPEAVSLASGGEPALRATVAHVEHLGHETLVHASVDGDGEALRIVARVPGMEELEVGAEVRLRLDPERLYVFDEAA
jgi:ABC-type sugar transport system ATPase subunit